MAVVEVTEPIDSPSGSINEKYEREYVRTLHVECDTKDDGPETILNSGEIPVIGNGYAFGNDTDANAWLRSIQLRRKSTDGETAWYWVVELKYSSARSEDGSDQAEENPLARPVRISGTTARYSVFTRKGRNTANNNELEFFKNSAGDLLEPIEVQVTLPVTVFVRNEGSNPTAIKRQYENTVNESAIWGAEERTLKITEIVWQKVVEGDYTYYEVTYSIEYNPEGYDYEPADAGFNELDGSGDLIEIRNDTTGQPVQSPHPLDGSGHAEWPPPAQPNTLGPYIVARLSNFYGLGLPDPTS